MRNRRIPTILAATAMAAAFGLTGCSVDSPTKDASPKVGTNADKTPAKKAPAKKAAPKEADNSSLSFGETAKWASGLSITVSKPTVYKPSEYSDAGSGKHLKFTITIVNNTGKPYESLLTSTQMQAGDVDVDQDIDSEAGLEGAPSTKLLNGRQAKYSVGFSPKKWNDLVLQVSPGDFTSDDAIYTGKA
jgi:hypothetical protein